MAWLTRWQIAQFYSCFIHSVVVLASGWETKLTPSVAWMQFAYQSTMIYLFTFKMSYVPGYVPLPTEETKPKKSKKAVETLLTLQDLGHTSQSKPWFLVLTPTLAYEMELWLIASVRTLLICEPVFVWPERCGTYGPVSLLPQNTHSFLPRFGVVLRLARPAIVFS